MISVFQFPKGTHRAITANFKLSEFDCQCDRPECHYTMIHPLVFKKLQELRKELGVALHLSSAFRCMEHNKSDEVKGSTKSKHTVGWAVDIVCPKGMPFNKFAAECKRIFKYTIEYKDKNFVHCDIRVLIKDLLY